MKRLQAFGAGVQSVAMFRLILEGRIERPDAIVFADTGAEPVGVYEVVARERKLAEAAAIPFHEVRWRDIKAEATDGVGHVKVPLFTVNKRGRVGMMPRRCTGRYKGEPIEKLVRSFGWKAEGCEQYLGITTDEIQRVRQSRKPYITHRYPFVEMGWNRNDCVQYLERIGVTAAKSACVFCPYRSHANWEAVKAVPEDWAVALAYDAAIRDVHATPGTRMYVHASRKPLAEAVDDPAPSLFDDGCAEPGYCGV